MASEYTVRKLLAAARLDLHLSGGDSGRRRCLLRLNQCEAPQAPSSPSKAFVNDIGETADAVFIAGQTPLQV